MTAIPKPKRERSEEYLSFVRSRDCLLLSRYGHVCSGPVEAHHITPKMGGKVGSKTDDRRALPFCSALHKHYHFLGSIDAFEERYPVILEFEIMKLQREYRPPVKKKREKAIGIVSIDVRCRCAQKTHHFPPSKVIHTETGLYWTCPILRERIEVE